MRTIVLDQTHDHLLQTNKQTNFGITRLTFLGKGDIKKGSNRVRKLVKSKMIKCW